MAAALVALAGCSNGGLPVGDGGGGRRDAAAGNGGGGGKGGGAGNGGAGGYFEDAPAEGGSGGAGGSAGAGGGSGGGAAVYAIDILFVITNSSNMEQEQEHLIRDFPNLLGPWVVSSRGLPDLHIGVVSPSLGAGKFTDVPFCPPGGDRGVLQNVPRGKGGACTAAPKDHYIISLGKGSKNNFSGSLADAFACIAPLGDGGCAFEHQLAAMKKALDGSNPENAGFLRDGAALAVIFLTDEDDCSAPADSDLFDPKQKSCADPLGPLSSYRCTEFGILCGGARPPRCSAAASLSGCTSAEDEGKLLAVKPFADFLKSLKGPAPVIVAALAGPAEPFSVMLDGAGTSMLVPSCTSTVGAADPAIRLRDFVDQFGASGTSQSICADSYGPALATINKLITCKAFGIGC